MEYIDFLKKKIAISGNYGFDIDIAEINPMLKPHQKDIVSWAISGGCRAIFASFGLGKSFMQLECCRIIGKRESGRQLIIAPLGVRQEFKIDAEKLGISISFIRRTEELDGPGLYITNYESIRDGRLDPNEFNTISLDEASVLRSYGSKTFQTFIGLCKDVRYKFVATATPSPNRYKELIHYAGFLGIMDTGQALTRFFKRDSSKAGNLQIHPHMEKEFWLWVSSWAIFLQRPSNLGYPDDGYILPKLHIHYHEVSSGDVQRIDKRDGQNLMFGDASLSLQAASEEKRNSVENRIEKMLEIVNATCGPRKTEKLSQGILSETQKRNDRRSKTERFASEGRVENIQGELLQGEQRNAIAETKKKEPRALSGEQRISSCKKQGVGRIEQRENDNTSKTEQGEEYKEISKIQKGLLFEQQRVSSSSSTNTEIKDIWTNTKRLREHDGCTERSLCNLRDGEQCKGTILSPCGSLPQNRESEGVALQQMQCGPGWIFGQQDFIKESDSIPEQFIVWCDLNEEQKAIEKALKSIGVTFVSLYGNTPVDDREKLIMRWKNKEVAGFISKPLMYGSGINMQQCCTEIFLGINFKANDFLQAIHRIWRFLQERPCHIHIIYASSEIGILEVLKKKWVRHDAMVEKMTGIIKKYGLSNASRMKELQRSMGLTRKEIKGNNFKVTNNDCVDESRRIESNSVGLIHTSIPFSNHYEYTASYNDFGFTENNDHFWSQMDYLTPELLRILKPGRIYACHVKDRILFGNVTGKGAPTVSPFHAECLFHGLKHGFDYMGMITVVTDVVRENNQTYRLGWSEQCKDGSKMGVGSPEYILIFRKPQSDRSKGYADEPIKKTKEEYSRARWQVDAHAFWRSSGDRMLCPDELAQMKTLDFVSAFKKSSAENIYDYDEHVHIGEQIDDRGKLPSTFMSIAPESLDPDVWTDVNRMLTLNTSQSQRNQSQHICLARGTRVLTKNGYKQIQKINIGDMVLTHKGRWKPVIAVKCTGVNNTVQVKAQGVPNLILTPDHKLWVRDATMYANEHAYVKTVNPKWLEASKTKSTYVNQKLPPDEKPSTTDSTFWWTVGRWLADGHIDQRNTAVISVGKHKWDYFCSKIGRFGGNKPQERTSLQIGLRDHGHKLRDVLKLCGHGAKNKHLPPEAFTLPIDQATHLLDGYLSGDGHFLKDRNSWTMSSVSKELLLGMSMIVQRVHGVISSVYAGRPKRKGKIEGREVNMSQDWIMSFYLPNENRIKKSIILEDGAWKKVRSVCDAGKHETWSLQVEEDASYTAEGCIVKNCPLQTDIVKRIINRYSNKCDIVFDPFGGIMTVPYMAIKMERFGMASELNPDYFRDGVKYLESYERGQKQISLFDFIEMKKDGNGII